MKRHRKPRTPKRKHSRKKFYVGLRSGKRFVFSSPTLPTEETHGHRFGAVVGPYKTKKEALGKIALM
jgi:hypothetical protein